MERKSIHRLTVGPLQANCYIVTCPHGGESAIIDPGGDADRIIDFIESDGARPVCIVATHAHPDHIAGIAKLIQRYGVPLMAHEDEALLLSQSGVIGRIVGLFIDPSPPPDRLLHDGEEIEIGKIRLKVLHTPGHSPGSICLLYNPGGGEPPALFSGDTLFEGAVGRTDLPGGSDEKLMNSLRTKIMPLPDNTRVFPGHGEETVLGREKIYNQFLRE